MLYLQRLSGKELGDLKKGLGKFPNVMCIMCMLLFRMHA